MLGADVYANSFANCHGADLDCESDWKMRDQDGYHPVPSHSEIDHTWRHPPAN